MKVTHISNSFIIVETNSAKIVCDPWVGRANYGGWHSYPEYNKEEIINLVSDANFVYISHIHDDHFDPIFLKESNLISKQFLLKSFTPKVVFNRIKGLGANSIIELDSWEIFEINKTRLSIIPQMASNNSEADDDVSYDMDTSIIIHDSGFTFFNQVDNPLSENNYKKIKLFAKKNFGEINLASLTCGAASEYPWSFINVDRKKEKERVINECLNKLQTKLEVLNPQYFFPAGGTYFIPGYLSKLNKYIAAPDFQKVEEFVEENFILSKPLFLEGGYTIDLNHSSMNKLQSIKPITDCLQSSIDNHQLDEYDFQLSDLNEELTMLEKIFKLAKKNWQDKVEKESISISQNIIFSVYNSISFDEFGDIDEIDIEKEFVLNSADENNLLKVYIHKNAFYKCLTRQKMVWNGTLGSLCLFERNPDIFYPNSTFSMNYLVLNKEQLSQIVN